MVFGNKMCTVVKKINCDVVVVGGGTTGITAAVAAAVNGAQTVLLEKNGCLGGNSTAIPAWLGFHSCDGEMTVRGIPLRIAKRLQEEGGATSFHPDPICGSVIGINTHVWKIIAAELVMESGVETLLHCNLVDIEKQGKKITALYAYGCDELLKIFAKQVIDCSDNGIVARLAGEKLIRGRERDNQVQVASWVFEVDNINFNELLSYLKKHPEDLRPFKLSNPAVHLKSITDSEVFVMGAFSRLIRQAKANGMNLERENMPGVAFPRQGKMMSVACRIEDFDTENTGRRSLAELKGAVQTKAWVRFLKEYVPGFENCQLSGSPMCTGVRETNHLDGQYILTANDLLKGKQFEDVIAFGGYHLDIHSPDHSGLETQKPPVYSIPYRCLLPKKTDNLVMAGRVIAATHEAQSSTRVIPISMAQGEAAGTAAAIAVRDKVSMQDVSITKLQNTLRKNGTLIDRSEVRREF